MHLKRVAHLFAELNSAPIRAIQSPVLQKKQIVLDIKRDDCLHPVISGNKWRKLKYLLLYIEKLKFCKIAVMGGRYSNLLHAVAYIGMRLNWEVTLYVRGYPQQALTPTLRDAIAWGAKIHYLSRVDYKKARLNSPELANDIFWISEGGYHELALNGCAETLMEIPEYYDFIVMATATGASIAGLAKGVRLCKHKSRVLGILVLNNAEQVRADIDLLIPEDSQNINLITGYEFGGYAKSSEKLNAFIEKFEVKHQIPLEPVYTGKSFFAVDALIQADYFAPKSRILLIHCGGLQGKLC